MVAGGRYDDLAGAFINKKLPGVGISIGFSRLFAKLLQDGAIKSERRSPADILVVLPSDERRPLALATARTLRGRGFKVETYHAAQKIGRQMSYAEKKGIPFVWFPPFDEGGAQRGKEHGVGHSGPGRSLESWTASSRPPACARHDQPVLGRQSEEAVRPIGVTGGANLIDLQQQRVAIAIEPERHQMLDMPGCFALAPQRPAGTRPIGHPARRQSLAQRVAVHPGQHQNLAAAAPLGNGRRKAGRAVERHRVHDPVDRGLGQNCHTLFFCHNFNASVMGSES